MVLAQMQQDDVVNPGEVVGPESLDCRVDAHVALEGVVVPALRYLACKVSPLQNLRRVVSLDHEVVEPCEWPRKVAGVCCKHHRAYVGVVDVEPGRLLGAVYCVEWHHGKSSEGELCKGAVFVVWHGLRGMHHSFGYPPLLHGFGRASAGKDANPVVKVFSNVVRVVLMLVAHQAPDYLVYLVVERFESLLEW